MYENLKTQMAPAEPSANSCGPSGSSLTVLSLICHHLLSSLGHGQCPPTHRRKSLSKLPGLREQDVL